MLEQHGVARRGKNLILTACDAGGRDMLEVSLDLMMRYAVRIGADFKVVQQQNHSDRALPRPHAVKFYVGHELDRYDRVVWIDADCLVSPAAPNIFDAIPSGYEFAAWCDEVRVFANAPVKRPVYTHGYFNSGVFMSAVPTPFTLAMRFLTEKDELLTSVERAAIMGEQTPLNKAVHDLRLPVFKLGAEWNFLLSPARCAEFDVETNLESAYIVHCAGGAHLNLTNPRDRGERAAGMRALRERLGW
jgi:hypothetical protein